MNQQHYGKSQQPEKKQSIFVTAATKTVTKTVKIVEAWRESKKEEKIQQEKEKEQQERERYTSIVRNAKGKCSDIAREMFTETFGNIFDRMADDYGTTTLTMDTDFGDGSCYYKWVVFAYAEDRSPKYEFIIWLDAPYPIVTNREDGFYYKILFLENNTLKFEPINELPRLTLKIYVKDLRVNPIYDGISFPCFYGTNNLTAFNDVDLDRRTLAIIKEDVWKAAFSNHVPPSIGLKNGSKEQQVNYGPLGYQGMKHSHGQAQPGFAPQVLRGNKQFRRQEQTGFDDPQVQQEEKQVEQEDLMAYNSMFLAKDHAVGPK